MFAWLWSFFRGYVAVRVTGLSVERFLNMAAHKGVYIWDVHRLDNENGIEMHCSVRDFRMLKNCARKTKSRLKIAKKQGVPFIMHRYRKRKILMGGIGFFILSLYVLSSFIWHIEIQGNERVTHEEILQFANDSGIRIGGFKHFVDHREITKELLLHFPDISWADIHTNGTRTTILVTEIIPETPLVPRDMPCNIVAARDGLITSIVTGAGIPLVMQNDVVRQGQVLVSGAVPIISEHTGESATVYVHAYAEVWAKMYTPFKFSVPLNYTRKRFTENVRNHYTIQFIMGEYRSINLFHGRISFDNYDKIVSHKQLGITNDYPLPIIWTRTSHREYVPIPLSRTVEEAKILAERIVTDRIISEFDINVDIIGKQVQFEALPDQLVVTALITTNERIDLAVPIELNTDS